MTLAFRGLRELLEFDLKGSKILAADEVVGR